MGNPLSIISKKLLKSGVITNEKFLELATKIMGLEKSIPVGSYQFKDVNINKNIINSLVYGSPEIKRITLLGGMEHKTSFQSFIKEMGFDYNNLIEIINDKNFIQSLGIGIR